MDKRSRYSGRSWCSMVAMDACSFATWASKAIVTLSRNRRCTRVLTVRRNHVAADMPIPIAAPSTSPEWCSNTPLPSSISHKARSASGSAASWDSTSDANIIRGSCRYPSLHSRHMEDSAGGSGAIDWPRLGEDVIRRALLVGCNSEALCLQIEHRSVAPAKRHQLVVCAELNHTAMFENANTVGMPNGGESMRDQDGGAVPRRRQKAVENLRFATHVELRGGFVEQHHASAHFNRRQCPRQGYPLPLPSGEICAAVISARKNCVERRQFCRTSRFQCILHDIVWRACGRDIVAQWQFKADEVLEHGGYAEAPRHDVELAKIGAVDLNPAGLRVVEPAKQFCDGCFARAVLPHDGE